MRRIDVASGEQFISSMELRDEIHNATQCTAVDMNLFGLHSALALHRIPSIHIRVVSDNADENAVQDFKQFIRGYQGDGGKILAEWVQSLPPDTTHPSQYPNLRTLFEQSTAK